MSRLAALGATILVVAAATAAPGAASAWYGHSKRQAEVNVLHATGVLKRWHVPILDVRTNTLKSNTRVSCVGTTRSVRQRFKAFTCTITYRTVHVRLRYTAFHGNGFGMKRLKPPPTTR